MGHQFIGDPLDDDFCDTCGHDWLDHQNRKCGGCGHDPACGFASVSVGSSRVWYCHDDDHSCYVGLSA